MIRHLALVGLPGSGKSTVARVLAARLGWDHADTDEAVEAAAGRSITSIMGERGEAAFREMELAALRGALEAGRPTVIACGGGLIAEKGAARLLLDHACVVWLDAPDAVLLQRLGGAADRPLLREDPPSRLADLRRRRQDAQARAHLRMSTDGRPPELVAAELAELAGAVRIDVPGRAYHVLVAPGAASRIASHLPAATGRVAVVADGAVLPLAHRLCRAVRAAGMEATVIPLRGGEGVKTWAAAGRLLERLAALRLERRDCVIATGGGTVGDLCGFAAAAYLRGVAWINVPTTLLAMVDSAVGGKTGVNLRRGKNLAGAFWQPRAVVCDTDVLSTLPDRAFRAAFSEIVKYSMVGDRVSPSRLELQLDALLQRDPGGLAETVRACCDAKGAVVATDEREGDRRAILNYGHTVAHALEAATGYGDDLWHGEAVAAGMRAAGRLSVAQLGCPTADIDWQDQLLGRCGLGAVPPLAVDAVMDRLGADKKAVGGSPRWVLLEARGVPRTGQQVPEALVRETLASLLAA